MVRVLRVLLIVISLNVTIDILSQTRSWTKNTIMKIKVGGIRKEEEQNPNNGSLVLVFSQKCQ